MQFPLRFAAAAALLAAVTATAAEPATVADVKSADFQTADVKAPPGFTPLFNGKNLDGWQGNIDMKQRATLPKEKLDELLKQRTKTAQEHWSVKDSAVHCDG